MDEPLRLETAAITAPKPVAKRVPYWHLVPFGVFIAVNALIVASRYNDVARIVDYLDPLPLFMMGMATFRIANIIANEKVTQIIRAPFVDVVKEDGHEVEKPKRRGFRQTIGLLIYCPSCVGVWVAAAIVYLFVFAPTVGWVVVAIFTLSGLENIFTGLSAWIHKQTD